MGLKNGFVAMLGTALVVWSGMAVAEEYRAGEFLGLDLSKAVLSSKRLGPVTEFAPVRIEARTTPAPPARAVRITPDKAPAAQQRAEKPRGAARTKLAQPRRNPLDAQASDTRVQAWPCRSGGICDWK